jgi:integrase/recombinase XerD
MPNFDSVDDFETAAPRIIEALFIHRDAIDRHLKAPMLSERETYLGLLLALGHKRKFVAERASMLRNVVEYMDNLSPAPITEEAITSAARQWAIIFNNEKVETSKSVSRDFVAVARSWFRHLGLYSRDVPLSDPAERVFAAFVDAMRYELGYLPSSLASLASAVRGFLTWTSSRQLELSSITLCDLDNFLAEGKGKGWKPRTVSGQCHALRSFFRYVERRGWNRNGLSKAIKAPLSKARVGSPQCPSWKQLRQLIASLDDSDHSQCRAKAILLLASVYGLRRSEIVRLTLEDLDWHNEIITVRRSKRGRLQQFPLQFEVGEAIIQYLKNARPACRSRNVFVTMHRPHRPATNIGSAIRKTMNAQGILDQPCGLHALRHACATELLRKGTSLRGIADFLGHRSIRSVSVYAHCDHRALREVANFSLSGVL